MVCSSCSSLLYTITRHTRSAFGLLKCPVTRGLFFPSLCPVSALLSSYRNLLTLFSLQRWTRDKVLSFVPPDGKFKLMDYRFAPATASAIAQSAVPLALRTSVTLDEYSGALDLVLSSRLTTRTMENVTIELYLGESASGASCAVSHGAAWTFNPRTKVRIQCWRVGPTTQP